MVFDHEEDISVVYTSERFMWNLTLRCKHLFMTSKWVKTKKNYNKYIAIFTVFQFCNVVILLSIRTFNCFEWFSLLIM